MSKWTGRDYSLSVFCLFWGVGAYIYRQIQFVRQVMAMGPERDVQNRNARQDLAVEPERGVQNRNARQDLAVESKRGAQNKNVRQDCCR